MVSPSPSRLDTVSVWIEESGNPFLLRQWRRSQRTGGGPLRVGLLFCGVAAGLLTLCMLLLVAFLQPWFQSAVADKAHIPAGLPGHLVRLLGTGLIGVGCWLVLLISAQLAASQTFDEEKQSSLELLLTIPQSRGRMVLQLAVWPSLHVVAVLVPLLPVVGCLMPVLGVDFGAALRLLCIVGLLSVVVGLRGPSGRAIQDLNRGRGGALQTGLAVVLILAIWPGLAMAGAGWFGIERLGLLSWPLGLAEATALTPACWRHGAQLGVWLVLLLLGAGVSRWLGAWRRFSEGSDYQPLPAAAVAWPTTMAALWLLAGLGYARLPSSSRDSVVWCGLCLACAALAMLPPAMPGTERWCWLWWAARRTSHPLPQAALRLADSLITVAFAPLIWRVGTGSGIGTLPVAAMQVLLAAVAVGAVAAMLGNLHELQLQRNLTTAGNEHVLRRIYLRANLLLMTWVVTACSFASKTWKPETSVGGVLLAWPVGLSAAVLLLALVGLFGPALAVALRPDGAGTAADRELAPSLLWNLLPRPWRLNPLAVKAHRKMRRQGLNSLLLVGMVVAGIGGMVPWMLGILYGQVTADGTTIGELLLIIFAAFWQGAGQAIAGALFGLPNLIPPSAAMLAAVCIVGGLLWVALFAMSAVLAGRMVTEERVAGSLGFLLMSPMTDAEVAYGFLVGHLYPVLEALVVFLAVLAVWSLAGMHWVVLVASIAVAAMLLGTVLLTSGLAFMGTARYETRANGTPIAAFGVLGLQFGCFLVFSTLAAVCSAIGGTASMLSALLLCLWSFAILAAGWLVQRQCVQSVGWLRRSGRLWRAFEATSARR